MSRLPRNMIRAEVPLFAGQAPATAMEGEVVKAADITLVVDGEPLPATVRADWDPHRPRSARLSLVEREPADIEPDEETLSDDIGSLLDQFVKTVEVPTPDREIVAEIGHLSASKMIGGGFFGVEGERTHERLEYEPATRSFEADVQVDITGSPEPVLRKFELE